MIPFVSGWALAVVLSGTPEIGLEAEPTTLMAIAEFPAGWAGRTARFTLQFDSVLEDWDPEMTSFAPRDWLGVRAWADEEFTWDRVTFDAPREHMFVRRDSGLANQLQHAQRFDRFEVQAVCREAFGGVAWIELELLVPSDERVGEGAMICVRRARAAVREARFEIAKDQLGRAKLGPLPRNAVARIEEMELRLERERVLWGERNTVANPTRSRGDQ